MISRGLSPDGDEVVVALQWDAESVAEGAATVADAADGEVGSAAQAL